MIIFNIDTNNISLEEFIIFLIILITLVIVFVIAYIICIPCTLKFI